MTSYYRIYKDTRPQRRENLSDLRLYRKRKCLVPDASRIEVVDKLLRHSPQMAQALIDQNRLQLVRMLDRV